MDDHVHLIVTPNDGWRLDQILHSWKSFTAQAWMRRKLRSGPVWQDESYDRIVRDEKELARAAEYMLDNPFRRWADIDSYPWLGMGSAADGVTRRRHPALSVL
jgi:hypothetical protein